jgi:hypothetical protein
LANYLYNNSKPDGLTIGNWNSALVLNQALGDRNVKFDARKFGWIGAPARSVPVCLIMGGTGLRSFEDIVKSRRTVKMGGTGPGSHSIDMPLMLNKMTGAKFSVVSGYQGGRHRYVSPYKGAKWIVFAPTGIRCWLHKRICSTQKAAKG